MVLERSEDFLLGSTLDRNPMFHNFAVRFDEKANETNQILNYHVEPKCGSFHLSSSNAPK